MTRSERNAAAAKRRIELKLKWLERIKASVASGIGVDESFEAITRSIEQDIKKSPQLKSEYVQAWTEFCSVVRKTAKSVQEEKQCTPPIPAPTP